jgi:hypothetical protein
LDPVAVWSPEAVRTLEAVKTLLDTYVGEYGSKGLVERRSIPDRWDAVGSVPAVIFAIGF